MRTKSIAKSLTGGLFGSLTDVLLWTIFVTGASFGKSGPQGVYKAFREADQALKQLNHRTISQAWSTLLRKGLVTEKKREGIFHAEITAYGRKRLNEFTPEYHEKRPWDGKVYLITFDIPEYARVKRNTLRRFLQRNNCKLLQESVWITPYNPRTLINEFVQQYSIPGTVIVSDIGKDGGIGETSVGEIIRSVYRLNTLNERYSQFLDHTRSREKSKPSLLLEYLSILRDDPQLPLPLLPTYWKGEKAYKAHTSLLNSSRL